MHHAILVSLCFGTSQCGEVASPYVDYVMDFSQFPGGGLYGANTKNISFSISLAEPTHIYAIPSANFHEGFIPPNVTIAQVLGSYCFPGSEAAVEARMKSDGEPGLGTSTSIDHVDVEMLANGVPLLPDGGDPESSPDLDGMCFGFRNASGWHWSLTPQFATWVSSDQVYRVRLMVQQGDIDALEIVFNSGPARLVRNIVLGTLPAH